MFEFVSIYDLIYLESLLNAPPRGILIQLFSVSTAIPRFFLFFFFNFYCYSITVVCLSPHPSTPPQFHVFQPASSNIEYPPLCFPKPLIITVTWSHRCRGTYCPIFWCTSALSSQPCVSLKAEGCLSHLHVGYSSTVLRSLWSLLSD